MARRVFVPFGRYEPLLFGRNMPICVRLQALAVGLLLQPLNFGAQLQALASAYARRAAVVVLENVLVDQIAGALHRNLELADIRALLSVRLVAALMLVDKAVKLEFLTRKLVLHRLVFERQLLALVVRLRERRAQLLLVRLNVRLHSLQLIFERALRRSQIFVFDLQFNDFATTEKADAKSLQIAQIVFKPFICVKRRHIRKLFGKRCALRRVFAAAC